jgi:hypothetical protein
MIKKLGKYNFILKNKFIRIVILALLIYLPFFLLISYTYFTEGVYVLTYFQEISYLLLGPIKLVLIDPRILIFDIDFSQINYIAVIPLIIMILFILIGILNFDKSKAYKIFFSIGMIIWFLFGIVAVGIYYLTA